MEELKDYRKNEICEKIDILTDELNDNELAYAIKIMQFWLSERKRQEEELNNLYSYLDNKGAEE